MAWKCRQFFSERRTREKRQKHSSATMFSFCFLNMSLLNLMCLYFLYVLFYSFGYEQWLGILVPRRDWGKHDKVK